MVTFASGSAHIRAGATALLAAAALLAAGAGSPAAAKIAYGITTGHIVYTFDTSAPNVEISHRAINITQLQPGESELAIDLRPATGQVYMLGSTSRLYVLDPSDGNVVPIAAAPFTPALSGTAFAMEFDPVTDTIRVISNTGQNLRVHPDTGAVIGVDTPLNPGTPGIAGAAYSNNHAGGAGGARGASSKARCSASMVAPVWSTPASGSRHSKASSRPVTGETGSQ